MAKGQIKAKLELEKQKLKQMKSFKDRLDYIWEYYKILITSTVITIFVIGYFINIIWINPPDKTAVGLTITNALLENAEVLKVDAEKALNIEPGYEVTITSLPLGVGEDISYQRSLQQKLMVMLAAREIDLIIGHEEFFGDPDSVEGYFYDISNLLTDSKYDEIRDRFIYSLIPIKSLTDEEIQNLDKSEIIEYTDELAYKDEPLSCIKRPVAVKLDGCKILEDLGYYTKNAAIGFITSGSNLDNSIKLFDYIMSIK